MHHAQTESTRPRILMVANETADSEAVHEAIGQRARGSLDAEVLVIAPALNSRLRHWTSDEDDARRGAARRLDSCLRRLRQEGLDATGGVGDADPLLAIEDALRVFAADEIIVATHAEGRSHWLARDFVARARARFWQPVVHVVAAPAIDDLAELARDEATAA